MRKLILTWLFGTDNIDDYCTLLRKSMSRNQEYIDQINKHLATLDEHQKDLNIIRKLIKICENHGVDVDKEIKNIEL